MKGSLEFSDMARRAGYRAAAVAVIMGLGVLGTQHARADEVSVLGKGADIKTMCGTKELIFLGGI